MAEGERRPEPRPSAESTIVGPHGEPEPTSDWKPPVPVGTVLGGRYRLLEALGRGGMGAVYRARDLSLDADVAVKLLEPGMASDPKRAETFRNEVRLARKVTHPNVCRLHDLVEADGHRLITMQFVEGESLAQRLRREGALPVVECVRLLRDVAAGLAAAHQAGVVHRDLKPANVLLTEGEGRAIVADFGIAAETQRGQPVDVAGTRGYMSPEQAAGKPVDARSDVYAFGVLAHRMLTGELPWTAPTRLHTTDVSGPPAAAPLDTPPALVGLIDDCLAASADDRPADGAALLARLASAPQEPAVKRRRGLAIPIAAVLLVAALLVWRPWRSSEPLVAAAPPPSEIVIDTAGAGRLPPEDAHLPASVTRLAIAELEDLWGVSARAAADGGAPATSPGSVRLSVKLWVGRERHFGVEATVSHGGRTSKARLESASLRDLAADLAAWSAQSAFPPAKLRPTPADLAGTCTRSPQAWRLWQRSRRESRMQRWSQARSLAGRAAELDPSFPLAPLEDAFTYMADDPALQVAYARSAELAAACKTLSPEWRKAFEAAKVSFAGDLARARKLLDEVVATPGLPSAERLYFDTRWAYGMWFGGDRANALPLLEWIAEKWPADPAVPKLLAHIRLEEDAPGSAAQALRHARQALAHAPYDVAVRADLARALLAGGDIEGAAAEARIIDAAEPGEKQGALAGSEADNSLVSLRLELGQLDEAERDARRLVLGAVTEKAQGLSALGALELMRGSFAAGIDRLLEAYQVCKDGGIETTAGYFLWRAAWQSYQTGELERAAELFGRFESETWRARARVMQELIAARRGKAARAALERARTEAAKLRPGSSSRIYLDMLTAHVAGEWKRVIALDEELRAAGIGGGLGPTYFSADALAALGDGREAEARFLRLATHPRRWKEPVLSVRAWRRLGELRERRGDRDGAAEAYRALVERWPRAPATQADLAAARAGLARLAR